LYGEFRRWTSVERDAEKFRDIEPLRLELKPDLLPALVNLGIAYYYDTNYEKAAEELQAALKIDPREPHAHFVLGLLNGKEYRKKWAVLDVKQANMMLDQIGLTAKDGDGYRLRTDGRGRLRIEIMTIGGQLTRMWISLARLFATS
jgi:tetratricopeptide (TPR) repeat protein